MRHFFRGVYKESTLGRLKSAIIKVFLSTTKEFLWPAEKVDRIKEKLRESRSLRPKRRKKKRKKKPRTRKARMKRAPREPFFMMVVRIIHSIRPDSGVY